MKRGPKKKPKIYEPTDPTSLRGLKVSFCEWLTVMHRSPNTLRTRGNSLEFFLRWCAERSLVKPPEINRAILEQYRRYVYYFRQPNGKSLSLPTQMGRLIAVRTFFQWMARQHHILYNPASELEIPRRNKKIPKHIPTVREIETILHQTDIRKPLGIRDRAILETLYSTGIRRSELMNLKLYDLALSQGTVTINTGKGGKDRTVPIGDRAASWVNKYLLDVRPILARDPDDGTAFLTIDGQPFSGNRLAELAHGYVERADIGKEGACHIFRHAMATHMLDAGADLRVIQEILGHESITTTEIYTHISIQRLKEVHANTHPAQLIKQR